MTNLDTQSNIEPLDSEILPGEKVTLTPSRLMKSLFFSEPYQWEAFCRFLKYLWDDYSLNALREKIFEFSQSNTSFFHIPSTIDLLEKWMKGDHLNVSKDKKGFLDAIKGDDNFDLTEVEIIEKALNQAFPDKVWKEARGLMSMFRGQAKKVV